MSGRSARRSKNGCFTCRVRKIKCDEVHPICGRCQTSRFACDWRPTPSRRQHGADKGKINRQTLDSGRSAHRQYRQLLSRDAFGFASSLNRELGNSLRLSAADRDYLVYFPGSAIARWVGKPWKWGFHRYLYTHVASRSSGVMRLILALSASELEGRKLSDPSLSGLAVSRTVGAGAAHYSLALQEFGATLAQHRAEGSLSRGAIEEIVATFFLMILYERNYGNDHCGLITHLSGVKAYLETCGSMIRNSAELQGDISQLTKNLLLLTLYLTLDHAYRNTSHPSASWVTEMDHDMFSDFANNLFLDSRDTNSVVFRNEYPQEALIDDIAVYQPLELCHECAMLRHWLLLNLHGDNIKGSRSALAFLRKVAMVGRRFGNLLRIADAEDPPLSLRELQTIYFAVAEYYALEIMSRRLDGRDDQTGLSTQLTKLIAVMKRVKSIDPQTMGRIAWPLAVAAAQVVSNSDDHAWVLETIDNTRQITGASSGSVLFMDTS